MLDTGREKEMEKKKRKKNSSTILLLILLILVLLFALITIGMSKRTYNKKVAEEKITEPDFYAMQGFCETNSDEVMKALKAGNEDKLKSLMTDSTGIEDVLAFAEWGDADFGNKVSLGAGSFSAAPDKNGRMDISERFFVDVGDKKYVLYVETLTSRHGMVNEGVSCVGVTTYDHFDELDYGWNGDKDDSSAVAGKSFLSKK